MLNRKYKQNLLVETGSLSLLKTVRDEYRFLLSIATHKSHNCHKSFDGLRVSSSICKLRDGKLVDGRGWGGLVRDVSLQYEDGQLQSIDMNVEELEKLKNDCVHALSIAAEYHKDFKSNLGVIYLLDGFIKPIYLQAS